MREDLKVERIVTSTNSWGLPSAPLSPSRTYPLSSALKLAISQALRLSPVSISLGSFCWLSHSPAEAASHRNPNHLAVSLSFTHRLSAHSSLRGVLQLHGSGSLRQLKKSFSSNPGFNLQARERKYFTLVRTFY
ncbi:hypothetical protein TorRG33x02_103540 [Trema orientale]|uniref:Uncharacterized protein n=1 Tax=Trema orientale TaxID=63057 RepID=A0A2P5F853_TREOI|nr:hypothetical protein TorRG33x02_103540 [Trema orientale]